MVGPETLTFDKYEVVVDAAKLHFDDQSLSGYLQTEGGTYDNFGGCLAMAERNLQNRQIVHEKVFAQRFEEAKDNGASDKLAEMKAKRDDVVIAMRLEVVDAQYVVNRLKNHLKAWDKNHENAQSLGHTLRRQMDKLNDTIYGRPSGHSYEVTNSRSGFTEGAPSAPVKGTEFESELSIDNLF